VPNKSGKRPTYIRHISTTDLLVSVLFATEAKHIRIMTRCPICFDPLSAKQFGNTAPCGHYFHEDCYNSWVVKGSKQLVTGEWYTKCPTCNTHCSSFIRSYLDLDTLNFDTISISSDESNDSNNDEQNDANSDDDSIDKWFSERKNRTSSTFARKVSITSSTSTPASQPEEIIILDSDDEGEQGHIYSKAPSSTSASFVLKKHNSPNITKQIQTPSSRTISDNKLKRKYKVLKQKLTAMKDSVALQQETNLENLNKKAETTAETKSLRESNEALSGKLEKESYDNRHNRREVQELRKEVDEYQTENESLKERLIVESIRHRKDAERWRQQVERAKASSMEEMKEIAQQKKKVLGQYDDLVNEWKSKDIQNKDFAKENAKLKRILRQYATEEVEELSRARKEAKPMSRSKKIELVKLARLEADEECLAEEVEAKALRKKMGKNNIVRKSSFQMQRVLAASNKQQKRRSRPTLASAASIAPDRQDANKRHIENPIRDPGSSIRSSNDLRNIFKKRK
jgi:hypothetical protein